MGAAAAGRLIFFDLFLITTINFKYCDPAARALFTLRKRGEGAVPSGRAGSRITSEEEAMAETVSLRRLEKGQHATIAAITADGEMGRRIRDMGLVPGVQVQVVGRAPLEDPVALRLMGFTLTLRNNEADYIQVSA